MASASYEIRVVDINGNYTDTVIDDFIRLSYTLVLNDIGSMIIELPSSYTRAMFPADTRFEIWRGIDSLPLTLQGDTQFLVQEITSIVAADGSKTLEITAFTLNSVLARRVVAYSLSPDIVDTFTEIVGPADDIMKEIFANNFFQPLDSTRDVPTTTLYMDTYESLSVVIGVEFAHRNILDVMKEVANTAYQLGSPLYFDIVTTAPPGGNLFRTYQVRGKDRRSSTGTGGDQLLLGDQYGNIGAYSIREKYTDEITFVYCAGPGEEDVRGLVTAEDTVRSGRSPFGRRELWEEYQDGDDDDKLTSRANALLASNRPRKIFEGEIVEVEENGNILATRYGRHWNWGDYATVSVEEDSFDVTISAVQVSVDSGKETVNAVLRSTT